MTASQYRSQKTVWLQVFTYKYNINHINLNNMVKVNDDITYEDVVQLDK